MGILNYWPFSSRRVLVTSEKAKRGLLSGLPLLFEATSSGFSFWNVKCYLRSMQLVGRCKTDIENKTSMHSAMITNKIIWKIRFCFKMIGNGPKCAKMHIFSNFPMGFSHGKIWKMCNFCTFWTISNYFEAKSDFSNDFVSNHGTVSCRLDLKTV